MYGFPLSALSLQRVRSWIFISFFLAICAGLVAARRYMGASTSQEMDPPAVIQPLKEHTASLIFLHGLGDRGDGWAQGLSLLKFQHLKCICPHAPTKPVTLNAGMKMPSWFDIHGLDTDSPQDSHGIKEASAGLQALVETEAKAGIPRERIFVGGFSQGGAVALYTAFAVNKQIGGVIALSTWLPLHKILMTDKETKYNTGVPVLQCHGSHDPLVRFAVGKETCNFVSSFNPNVEFKSYDGMMHSSCPEEMQDVKAFLEKHLGS